MPCEIYESRSIEKKKNGKIPLFSHVQIHGHPNMCVCSSSPKMTAGPTGSGPIDISDRYPRSVTSVVHPSVSSGRRISFISFFFPPTEQRLSCDYIYIAGMLTFVVLWKPARDEIFDPLKNSPQHLPCVILFLSRQTSFARCSFVWAFIVGNYT